MSTSTEIREYVADFMAATIVFGAIYMASNMISMTQEYVVLLGAASTYLFLKYTPNSQ